MSEPEYEESRALVEACSQALAGHDPLIQGAVLAELITMWVCGHHPAPIRPLLLDGMFAMVKAAVKRVTSPESPPAVPAGSDPGQKIH